MCFNEYEQLQWPDVSGDITDTLIFGNQGLKQMNPRCFEKIHLNTATLHVLQFLCVLVSNNLRKKQKARLNPESTSLVGDPQLVIHLLVIS